MILPKKPFRVEFEVISTCNLNCSYCYAKPFNNSIPEFDKIKYLLSKTSEEVKPFEAVILGGEPFLRKDIVKVLEYAYNAFDGNIGVSTNGTRLSNLDTGELERLRSIFTFGNKRSSIQVSIDSIDPTVNDKTRGMTKQSIKGIETLERNDINFSVGIVISRINYKDIANTIEYLLSNYSNVKSINLEPIQPTVSMGKDEYEALRCDNNVVLGVYKVANELKIKTGRKDVNISGMLDENCKIKIPQPTLLDEYGFKSCTAGLLRAGVFTSGDVTPCVTIRNVTLGNLFNESWDVIWGRALDRYLKLDVEGGQCQINMLRRENPQRPIKVVNKTKQKT